MYLRCREPARSRRQVPQQESLGVSPRAARQAPLARGSSYSVAPCLAMESRCFRVAPLWLMRCARSRCGGIIGCEMDSWK